MRVNILGINIDNLTFPETLARVKYFFTDNQQHQVITLNPEFVVLAQEDEEFRKIINQSDLVFPDGMGLMLASVFLGQKLKQRITGVDFAWQLAKLAEQADKSIFLLGGLPGVAEKTAEVFKKKFPNLKIAGVDSGGEIDPRVSRPDLIKKINKVKPNILLVALGQGKQEKWIYYYLKKIPSVDVAIGVGGTFDYLSGGVRRAPKFLRKLGLEWLWRLILQPWRWKRIFTATCKFSYLVVKWKARGGFKK